MWPMCRPLIRVIPVDGEAGEVNVMWDDLEDAFEDLVKGYQVSH